LTDEVETISEELINEMDPLLREHYHEVAMYQDKIELNPCYDTYFVLEDQNSLRIFTWRDEEGMIIGYNVFFIKNHPHYQDTMYAVNDIIYVHPGHRGMEVPPFLQWCEHQLWSYDQVDVVTYHMKENKPFHGLMEFLEYDHAEHTYTKYVG
jgi:hypothetical protein